MIENPWTAKDSQDNALATATHAAATDQAHVIDYVTCSYSVAGTSGLLQVKEGSTVIEEHYIHGADTIPLGYKAAKGSAVSAELAASGTAGQIGKVNIIGHSH